MASIDDLTDQAAAMLTGLGFDTTVIWPEREKPISGSSRAHVRVVSTSQVARGSNEVVRVVELEVTCARKRVSTEDYATVLDWLMVRLDQVTRINDWSNLAAVRQSPLPEIEIERDVEKVGQVLVFSVRVNVALEG